MYFLVYIMLKLVIKDACVDASGILGYYNFAVYFRTFKLRNCKINL